MFEQNNVGIRLASPLPTALLPALRHMLAGGVGSPAQREFAGRLYLPLLHRVLEDWRAGAGDEDEEAGDEDEEGEMEMETEEEEEEGLPPPATPEAGVALLDACAAESDSSGDGDGDDGDGSGGGGLFSALDGTALLSLICCMNHSCAPNCEVRWAGGLGGGPVVAELVALRPLVEGDELYQSYVKVEGTTVDVRRAALRDYGFLCSCLRCVAEEKGV